MNELQQVAKKYGQERRTDLLDVSSIEEESVEESVPDYPVTVFFTKEGYFKKITPQSLRMSAEQKLKDGDALILTMETSNAKELLFFTDKMQVYKARVSDFNDTKASVLGDYVPSKLSMEEGESTVFCAVTDASYAGFMLFLFQNGKAAKVNLNSYATKANRKKLIKAYSDKAPLACMMQLDADKEIVIETTEGRSLLLDTALINPKAMKDTQGVACFTLKKKNAITLARDYVPGEFVKPYRYRAKSLPCTGALLSTEDIALKNNVMLF